MHFGCRACTWKYVHERCAKGKSIAMAAADHVDEVEEVADADLGGWVEALLQKHVPNPQQALEHNKLALQMYIDINGAFASEQADKDLALQRQLEEAQIQLMAATRDLEMASGDAATTPAQTRQLALSVQVAQTVVEKLKSTIAHFGTVHSVKDETIRRGQQVKQRLNDMLKPVHLLIADETTCDARKGQLQRCQNDSCMHLLKPKKVPTPSTLESALYYMNIVTVPVSVPHESVHCFFANELQKHFDDCLKKAREDIRVSASAAVAGAGPDVRARALRDAEDTFQAVRSKLRDMKTSGQLGDWHKSFRALKSKIKDLTSKPGDDRDLEALGMAAQCVQPSFDWPKTIGQRAWHALKTTLSSVRLMTLVRGVLCVAAKLVATILMARSLEAALSSVKDIIVKGGAATKSPRAFFESLSSTARAFMERLAGFVYKHKGRLGMEIHGPARKTFIDHFGGVPRSATRDDCLNHVLSLFLSGTITTTKVIMNTWRSFAAYILASLVPPSAVGVAEMSFTLAGVTGSVMGFLSTWTGAAFSWLLASNIVGQIFSVLTALVAMYQGLKIVEKSERVVHKLKRAAYHPFFQITLITVFVGCFPGLLATILKCMPVPVQMIASLCGAASPGLAAVFALPHLFTIPMIANGIGKAVSKIKYTWGTAARETTETLINTSHIVGLIVESMMDIAQIGALLTTGTAYKDGDTLLGMIPYRNTGCASSLLEDMLKAMAVPTRKNPFKPELEQDYPAKTWGEQMSDYIWSAPKTQTGSTALTVASTALTVPESGTGDGVGAGAGAGAGAGVGAGDPDMDPASYAWYGDLPEGRGGRRRRRDHRQIVPFSEYHMYL